MTDPAAYLPPVMSDVVIDESHWQATPNFALVRAAGIAAVIFKATQGSDYVDPTFAARATAAAAAGLLVGAYHFLDGSNAAAQAAHFFAVAGSAVSLLALDFEPNPTSQPTPQQAATVASLVKASTGRWPVIYTGRWMLSQAQPVLAQCPLWLAEYGSNPVCPPGWSQWKLWQHTDGHVGSAPVPVPGIGPCDRSRFAGSVTDLTDWWENPKV